MLSRSPTVPRAIRTYNDALADLYFQHRETVLQLQNTLFTQVLPNALDELGLGSSARDWVQEWVQDDRESFTVLSVLASLISFSVYPVFIFRTLKVRSLLLASHRLRSAFDVGTTRSSRGINSQRRLHWSRSGRSSPGVLLT